MKTTRVSVFGLFAAVAVFVMMAVVVVVVFARSAHGATRIWNNSGTDFNTAGSWTNSNNANHVVPNMNDTAQFDTAAVMQPNLSASLSISQLLFTATGTGYDLTASAGISLTLLSTGTGGNSALNSQVAGAGGPIIHAPVILGAAAASTQTFTQAAGGTLTLEGAISSANAITFSLAGNGTFDINGPISLADGSTLSVPGNGTVHLDGTISGTSITVNLTGGGTIEITGPNTYSGTTTQASGSTIVIGNKAAFGTSTINLTSNSGKLEAGTDLTGANAITNPVTWAANATLRDSGAFGIQFDGNVDLGGAGRTIESQISGGATFNGIISNDGGGGVEIVTSNGSLVKINGVNTYVGNTSISGNGKVSVASIGNAGVDGNLGAGSTINLGNANKDGNLVYTGAGETTNRTFNLSGTTGGAQIEVSSATGPLVITSDLTATGVGNKTLVLRGGNDDTITGKIVDSAGGTTALGKAGAGLWILSGANTYSGGTLINNGSLRVDGANATLGVGDVTVDSSATKLEITTGVLDAINDSATLSLAGGGTVGLADNGFAQLRNGVDEIIGALLLNGVLQAPGTYGSSTSGAANQSDEFFEGKGMLTVVPEPSSWAMAVLGAGLLVGAQRLRGKRS